MRRHVSFPAPWLELAIVALAVVLLLPTALGADPVAVRHPEGGTHGFLLLRAPDGRMLADGDLIQDARDGRVTSRVVFRFADGSLHDETSVFSQTGHFRLLSNHLVQEGPSFPRSLDMTIDAASGVVVVRHADDRGRPKVEVEHLALPPDLANGLVQTLLKNLDAGSPRARFPLVVATPRPRLVTLDIEVDGRERFVTGTTDRLATRYVVHVDIGGVAGLLARVAGKQPPDSHVWMLGGEVPAFIKASQPFYAYGPVWRIEMATPVTATH